MALTVTHAFNVNIADDPKAAAAGEVLPSHWNANHTIAGAIDLTSQTTGTLPIASGGTNATSFTTGTLIFDGAIALQSASGTAWDNTNKALSIASSTALSASAPIFTLSQGWNNAAVIFTGFNYNITKTAADRASRYFNFGQGGIYGITGIPGDNSNLSTTLYIYDNNFGIGDDTNYTRGKLGFDGSSHFVIGVEHGGTGLAQSIIIQTDSGQSLNIKDSGGNQIFINPGNSFIENVNSGIFFWQGRSLLYSDADGQVRLANNNADDLTDVSLLFALTSASAVRLRRPHGTIQLRCELADGSANADFYAKDVYTQDASFMIRTATTLTTAGTGSKTGTLATAPSSGDPTKWIPIDDNGVTRYIPAW